MSNRDGFRNGDKSPGGMFKPGGPGGPGRPKGSRSKLSKALDGLVTEAEAREILTGMMERAKGGDTTAARLVLDRVWPIPKGRLAEVDLPSLAKPEDIIAALGGILAAVAGGDLSTEEAKDLATILETQRRAIETADIERRLTELEKQRGQ